ncbi:MAG: nitroreductase [Oceanospirillaceae bacterium]|nr:nitroreductase [Oceanospirillaceae bacterium]MBT13519.1 nitroreductase [Oceanospirillaceae bacterium]|tara:strand:+ start:106349 stop:106915 length:567 start_codon:yes stop_codon:yes gene_type:complete
MNAIQALTERVSVAQLTGPDLTPAEEDSLFLAALRAADHAWMRPSRYLTVRGDDRAKLGRLFLESAPDWQTLPDDKQAKLLNMPMRAPLIVVAVCTINDHPKVSREEQLMSTAAGVQNMLNAAWAQGLGAIWRTGEVAYNRRIAEGLGLAANEEIVAFVYLGRINAAPKPVPELPVADFVQSWPLKSS